MGASRVICAAAGRLPTVAVRATTPRKKYPHIMGLNDKRKPETADEFVERALGTLEDAAELFLRVGKEGDYAVVLKQRGAQPGDSEKELRTALKLMGATAYKVSETGDIVRIEW